MKKLSNLLALLGTAVAILAVVNAYLVKSRWGYLFDWRLVTDQTYFALALAVLLIGAAYYMRSRPANIKWRDGKVPVLVVGALCLLSMFTVARTSTKMARAFRSNESSFQASRYGFYTAPVQAGDSKYDFATDYVTSHTAYWKRYLTEYQSRPSRALEIGSFEGRSALWFLENILIHPQSTITCIDIFESDYEKFFDKNIAISGLESKMKKYKGDSRRVLRTLEPITYDFAYIDGSHVAMDVLTDAVLVWDLVKPGGIIIFDDYQWPGSINSLEPPAKLPEIAIDAFLTVYAPYIDVIHRDYQVIVKKRTSVDLQVQKHSLTTRAWRILFW